MKSKLNIIAIAAATLLNSLTCVGANAKPIFNKPLNTTLIPENSVYGIVKIKTLGSLPAGTTCNNIVVTMRSEKNTPSAPGSLGSTTPIFKHMTTLNGNGWLLSKVVSSQNTAVPADCYYLITPAKDQLGEKVIMLFSKSGSRTVLCPPTDESSKFLTLGDSKRIDFTMESGCIDTSPR
jgi:hypothetical protein